MCVYRPMSGKRAVGGKQKIQVAGTPTLPPTTNSRGYYSTSTNITGQGQGFMPNVAAYANSSPPALPTGVYYPPGQSNAVYRGPTVQAQEKLVEGADFEMDLSPRGKHRYPPVKSWNCTDIVAWLAFVFAFILAIFVIILYYNVNGPLNQPTMVAKIAGGEQTFALGRGEDMPALASTPGGGQIRAKDPALVEAMRHLYHNHTQHIHFELSGQVGKFARWPPKGILEGLEYATLATTRLCCHVGTQYFVCDYGQGATSNIALECLVKYDADAQGSFLMIYIQSDHMKGASCTFTWTTRDRLDKTVLKDHGAPAAGEREKKKRPEGNET